MNTLTEVAERTGKSSAVLRKHIERGKLRASKDSGRVLISDDDLEAYLAGEELERAADEASAGNMVEAGNIISRLPQRIRDAILDGIPSGKRAGGPESFRKAAADVPKRPAAEVPDEPHFGFPVGHQHRDSPRWKRTSKSTWTLGDARFAWNGFAWEGSGSKEGTTLGEGVSPAATEAVRRPLAPAVAESK